MRYLYLLVSLVVCSSGIDVKNTVEKSCIVDTSEGQLNLKPLAKSSGPA